MLKHIKIFNFTESDIDKLIQSAGGVKIPEINNKNEFTSDYLINEAIVELKLINEEGFQKENRQKELGDLFEKNQPGKPVKIIHPKLLNKNEQKKYNNIIEKPIKTAIKKGNTQLKETNKRLGGKTKVLLIINNGYQGLSASEFEDIAFNRTKNDTSNIDHLIITGIYFYGDSFDYYAMSAFKLYSLNVSAPFPSYNLLLNEWNQMLDKYMTSMIQSPDSLKLEKLPVVDISFEYNGNTFVKPPPPIGKESVFFRNGRPRLNNSSYKVCPPTALILPSLSYQEWSIISENKKIPELKNSYSEYLSFLIELENQENNLLQPVLKMPVTLNNHQLKQISNFAQLCENASIQFNIKAKNIAEQAYTLQNRRITPISYILLFQTEIGQDENFDLASLFYIRDSNFSSDETTIFEDKRIIFLHALALAATYAIKYETDHVVIKKDNRFGWV